MLSIPAKTISHLITLIERAPCSASTKLVAIDGRGGSGKSSLAEALANSCLNAQVVHIDDFPCREQEHPFHPSGTQTRVNLDRLISEVLIPLRAGEKSEHLKTPWWATQVQHPEVSCSTTPGGTVIVEGCYALHRASRDFFDVRIWVECSASIAMARAVTRDRSPGIQEVWRDVYVPNESAYIRSHVPREAADIVVYNDLENVYSIDDDPCGETLQRLTLAGLRELLGKHSDKRVTVLGTTCTGKSTMLASIPGARDQDKEVFAKLTKEQSEYVCQEPWTEEIGRVMTGLVRAHVTSEVGRPVFGTVVIDCDLIILLKISDATLRERAEKRKTQFSDAKNMQIQLEREVACSGIPFVEYSIG